MIYQVVLALLLSPLGGTWGVLSSPVEPDSRKVVKLPQPHYVSEASLEQCLFMRRSVRSYSKEPLTVSEISQVLWAAQGITSKEGKRTAPSAGALYPLEIYLVAGNVTDLEPGVYKYRPVDHVLVEMLTGDLRLELSEAAGSKKSVGDAAVVVAIAAVYQRTQQKYKKRGVRYVHMEAGHAAQNAWLQAQSLQLGAVTVGGFDEKRVAALLRMEAEEEPVYLLPVGRIE
jgi:SagB-type dehydrogenase family enzyme